MNNIITFSARGTKFIIPKILLKKYPDILLNNLCDDIGIPIDKINNSIIIDINPSTISILADLYYYGDATDQLKACSISEYMDLKFLGFDVKYDKLLPHMIEPIICSHNAEETCQSTYKLNYVNIHTIDNNIIVVDRNIINSWENCKFKSIICGFHDEYIIDKHDDHIDVSVGLNLFKTHYILSIMRDGLNYYYYDYPLVYNLDIFENIIKPISIDNIYVDNTNIEFCDWLARYSLPYRSNSIYIAGASTIGIDDIANGVSVLKKNQDNIVRAIDTLKNIIGYNYKILNIENSKISEYMIDHKVLRFYGILGDYKQHQLATRPMDNVD